MAFLGIDPTFTDSIVILTNEWILIRPDTDITMLLTIAYKIITKKLHDDIFIEKYTIESIDKIFSIL